MAKEVHPARQANKVQWAIQVSPVNVVFPVSVDQPEVLVKLVDVDPVAQSVLWVQQA